MKSTDYLFLACLSILAVDLILFGGLLGVGIIVIILAFWLGTQR